MISLLCFLRSPVGGVAVFRTSQFPVSALVGFLLWDVLPVGVLLVVSFQKS
jgi:hypothetical protein